MNLSNAILQCFLDDPDRIFSVQEICDNVRKYYTYTPFQEELDPNHPQPRYEHQVRSRLARAKKSGYIIRIGWNQYCSA